MNPVIGLDVAKSESQVQSFLDKKKPYKKSIKLAQTLSKKINIQSILYKAINLSLVKIVYPFPFDSE